MSALMFQIKKIVWSAYTANLWLLNIENLLVHAASHAQEPFDENFVQ